MLPAAAAAAAPAQPGARLGLTPRRAAVAALAWALLPALAHFAGSRALDAIVSLLTVPLLALAWLPAMLVTGALARWLDGDVVYGVISTLLVWAQAYGVLRLIGRRPRSKDTAPGDAPTSEGGAA